MRLNQSTLSIIAAVSLLMITAFAADDTAKIFDAKTLPEPNEKCPAAEFRLWLPPGATPLNALIIKQHGCGRTGLTHADDLQWQALAEKWHCGLLGSNIPTGKNCSDWCDPEYGSEAALLRALKDLSAQAKRPELNEIPWAIWGHSGGAMWGVKESVRMPQRILGVFARSGKLIAATEQSKNIPVLVVCGVREQVGRFKPGRDASYDSFMKSRVLGANWSWAEDPTEEHGCSNCRDIAIPFLNEALSRRLTLPDVLPGPPWLGNPQTFELADAREYNGDASKMSWLFDEYFAKRWQEFCKTGKVADTTPPPSPENITITASKDGGVNVRWRAQVDPESGIRFFHIYRGGAKAGDLGGEKAKENGKGYYQTWNYGDEAVPGKVADTIFHDPQGTEKSVYRITAENGAGLESK